MAYRSAGLPILERMADAVAWEDKRSDGGSGGYTGGSSYVSGSTGSSAHDPLFDRVPPHDDDAEMAVLGGMLMSKDAIGEVSQMIDVADFYQPKHQLSLIHI